jgi:hypothetical protein
LACSRAASAVCGGRCHPSHSVTPWPWGWSCSPPLWRASSSRSRR